jgi:hypothetical protein
MKPLLRSRWIRRGAIILLLLATLVVGAWLAWDACNTTPGEIEALIDRNLSRGDSAEEILTFLREHDAESPHIGTAGQSYMTDEGIPLGTPIVFGWFRGTRVSWCEVDAALVFVLDDQNRLDYYRVIEVYTCL